MPRHKCVFWQILNKHSVLRINIKLYLILLLIINDSIKTLNNCSCYHNLLIQTNANIAKIV